MRLIRFHADRGLATAVLTERGVVDLGPDFDDFAQALTPDGQARASRVASDAVALPLASLRLAAPIASGARLFCIGLNYRDHVGETGRDMPAQPSVFLRTTDSVVAHGQPMRRPAASVHFDYEGELGVVIGTAARRVTETDAPGIVAGYTCFNDGSVRDFQKHSVTAGKNFENSGACGPWVVTAEALPDPTRLTLCTRLNGVEVQRSGTDQLIYGIALILSYLSSITTLRPGDIVATGTPAGVGARRTPPLWMKPGDRIEVEITGIGTLSNPIEAES